MCRLMNYSKYKYEQEKKARETRNARRFGLSSKSSRCVQHRRARLRQRLKAAKKFLEGGKRKVICPAGANEFRDLGRDMFVLRGGRGRGSRHRRATRAWRGTGWSSIAPVKEKSANNVSAGRGRNKRKQVKKDAAAAAEGAAGEDEDGSYDEDDEEVRRGVRRGGGGGDRDLQLKEAARAPGV